jgi:hypothetical protein
MKVVRASPLSTGRIYPPGVFWYSFLEAESNPGHMVPSVASKKLPRLRALGKGKNKGKFRPRRGHEDAEGK